MGMLGTRHSNHKMEWNGQDISKSERVRQVRVQGGRWIFLVFIQGDLMYKIMNGSIWKVEFLDNDVARIITIGPDHPEYEAALAAVQAAQQAQPNEPQQTPPA